MIGWFKWLDDDFSCWSFGLLSGVNLQAVSFREGNWYSLKLKLYPLETPISFNETTVFFGCPPMCFPWGAAVLGCFTSGFGWDPNIQEPATWKVDGTHKHTWVFPKNRGKPPRNHQFSYGFPWQTIHFGGENPTIFWIDTHIDIALWK